MSSKAFLLFPEVFVLNPVFKDLHLKFQTILGRHKVLSTTRGEHLGNGLLPKVLWAFLKSLDACQHIWARGSCAKYAMYIFVCIWFSNIPVCFAKEIIIKPCPVGISILPSNISSLQKRADQFFSWEQYHPFLHGVWPVHALRYLHRLGSS